MKKHLLTFSLLFTIMFSVNGQIASNTSGEAETPCYTKWAKKFEVRGADEVTDGTYTDVIISVRNGSNEDCYVGKCDVKDGKIITMYIKMEDGKYDLFKRKPRYEQTMTITNGMSKTVITVDDELINVLFIKKMKPKKAEFQKAPDPDAE